MPGARNAEWFHHHEHGTEMVVVPAGSFVTGSQEDDREMPPREVTIARPFAVGRFEVMVAEYRARVAE